MRLAPFRSRVLTLALAVGPVAAWAAEPAPPPQKAVGSVELKAPPTPLKPTTLCCPMKEVPPLDVSSLSIRSDGTRLTFSTTLTSAPGATPGAPVTIYVDADNNAATGAKADPTWGVPGGVEYKAELTLCIGYSNGSESCAGGSGTSTTVTKRYAAFNLAHYKGTATNEDERVLSAMGFPEKAAVQAPVTGQVVEAALDYADLKVKPGQTIRLYPVKTGGGRTEHAEFPVVLLTLK